MAAQRKGIGDDVELAGPVSFRPSVAARGWLEKQAERQQTSPGAVVRAMVEAAAGVDKRVFVDTSLDV